jgi:hypothetical protein
MFHKARFALCWLAGVALVVVLFIFGDRGILKESTVEILLWPAIALGALAGIGAHDAALYLVILIADSLLYGVIAFGLLELTLQTCKKSK